MFQVDLFPCPHALAVIAHTKGDPYDYCSYYYTKDAYMKTYQEFVLPVGDPSEWTVPVELNNKTVLAPFQKRSSGRPAEKRKRSASEGK